MARVVIGLSGGVDSSVAAYLLKQQGHDVVGLFMINWHDTTGTLEGDCPWHDDRVFAELVAKKLDIPLHVVDLSADYRTRVVDYMFSEYEKGRTPNPDVLCNREIKFRAFLDYALKLGASRMATGHFVRSEVRGGRPVLLKGADAAKDQSYFLYMLKEAQLAKSLFPVGGMTKAQVREIARQNGLPVASKKDSTGVCFIGERNFRQFLQGFLPMQPGDMRTEDGETVGEHIGLAYYTLGQRRGLGIGGRGDGRSWFVIGKDLEHNVLLVSQGEDSPRLYSRYVRASQATWIAESAPMAEGESCRCTARFRYRQADQAVTVTRRGDELLIEADELQRAVTPGQSVVLYQGDVCLGGGIAEEAWK